MDALALTNVSASAVARYWQKVIPAPLGKCWGWTGTVSKAGYGRLSDGGRAGHNRLASRVAFVLHHRPLAAGELVLHHCDNPPCTAPDHIYAGTMKQNVADMDARGRGKRGKVAGEDHKMSLFTNEQVLDIRRRVAVDSVTHKQLASEFGVSRSAITQIVRGANWKHLLPVAPVG